MEQLIDEQPSAVATKPRKVSIAFLFSILSPGLGQFYNGQAKKGLIFFISPFLLLILFWLTGFTHSFIGLFLLVVGECVLRIYFIIDSVKLAKLQNDFVPKWYNKGVIYCLIIVAMSCFLFFVNTRSITGIETFKGADNSGSPNVMKGDYLVADMRTYNNADPDYGDIVVCRPGYDEHFYYFRVVGKTGDYVEVQNNRLVLNGKSVQQGFDVDTLIEGVNSKRVVERLPNGHFYQVLDSENTDSLMRRNMESTFVPANSYFLMCDNRSVAIDSRYFGSVTKDQIYGQLLFIYWSPDQKRLNVDLRKK